MLHFPVIESQGSTSCAALTEKTGIKVKAHTNDKMNNFDLFKTITNRCGKSHHSHYPELNGLSII